MHRKYSCLGICSLTLTRHPVLDCADKDSLGTRHVARDAMSQPVTSTPSLDYTELIASAAPQMLSLALRKRVADED